MRGQLWRCLNLRASNPSGNAAAACTLRSITPKRLRFLLPLPLACRSLHCYLVGPFNKQQITRPQDQNLISRPLISSMKQKDRPRRRHSCSGAFCVFLPLRSTHILQSGIVTWTERSSKGTDDLCSRQLDPLLPLSLPLPAGRASAFKNKKASPACLRTASTNVLEGKKCKNIHGKPQKP